MTAIFKGAQAISPVFRELTGRRKGSGWLRYFDDSELPGHILRSEGFAGSGARGLFELYEEMEQKDGHLFAVLQTRKNGVLSRPRKVVAASESAHDQEVARFVDGALKGIGNFDQSLLDILDAVGKGLSVQEIIWRAQGGRVLPVGLKSREPGRFAFDEEGRPRLSPMDGFARFGARGGAAFGKAASEGRALPERKFVIFTFGGLYESSVGRGLCGRAYWYYWFKKKNLKFWVIYNEKFGAPTVVGKYRPGASDEDRERLFEVIESLQNDTGVTVPDSISVELLEARRSGSASTYRDLADWCNDEISKIVLGATLTSGEGRRSGSNALGEVHERVRNEYVEADARALENVVNGQLVRFMVDFNFGAGVEAPHWTIDTSRDDHLEREVAIDRQLIEAGIALPESYFYEKYKRPAPLDQEPALRFDDRNLFQYHLRYGVLTINEARKRLGLPAVPWGERPAQLVGSPPEEGAHEADPKSELEESDVDAGELETE